MSDKHQKPKPRNNAAGFTKAGRNSRTGGKNRHAEQRTAGAQGTYANGRSLFEQIRSDQQVAKRKDQVRLAQELLNTTMSPKGLNIAEGIIKEYGEIEGTMPHEVRLEMAIANTFAKLSAEYDRRHDYAQTGISRAKGSLAAAHREQRMARTTKAPSHAARQMAAMAGAR